MKRLSGMDSAFLQLETPSTHMHVQALMLLDPATVPGGYSFGKIKAHIASRVPKLAEFRQRLAPVPFDMHRPVWFDDPDFDLDYHVRHIAVPPPGDMEQLADIVGEIAGRPLDRSRPLWEFWIVEGVEHGAVAVVAKMHHSTIDGVSGSSMASQILDLEPVAIDEMPTDDSWNPEHKPSDLELLGHAITSRLRRPFSLATALMAPQLARAAVNVVRVRRDPSTTAGGTPLTAPRTPFNAPITPHRRVAFTSVPLAEVKAIKNFFGCTVNDVVLATLTGALRAYLLSLDALPDRPLLATCPVSVRTPETEDIESANKISAMFVPLPSHLDDPAERVAEIRQSTVAAKQEHHAVGARTLLQLGESAAPRLFGLASRLFSGLARRGPVPTNLVISNVPGPPFPLYLGGARLVSMLPLGPPLDGIGLNVTVLSYIDHVDWGFIACRELAPGLWGLADAVRDAHAELVKASTA
jgi:diacylglycerol O-acyltransferase / wax synthase